MRRFLSLLCRQGICLLLAASYIVCLCAASLNAAPTVAEAGSIASLELLPRAENPHLSPDDPALAASIPETSGKSLQSWESLFPLLLVILWPHLFDRLLRGGVLVDLFRAVRLRLRDHRLPRHTDIRGLLPLPAAPPLADPPFFAEDSIMFSRRIMQRRAACV